MRTYVMVAGAALALLGCTTGVAPVSEVAEGISVSTNRSSYAIGDAIELTIRNRSSKLVGYTLCPGTWERRQGDEWLRSEQLMICADHLEQLAAGSVRRESVEVPEGFEAGEHRLVVHLDREDRSAVSNSFLIEPTD